MKLILIGSLMFAAPVLTHGLDIPLDGGQGTGRGMSIGYVDMEKIFQLYPKTKTAKEDYAKQLRAKREELSKKEADLNAVKNRLAVLESTLKNGQPDTSAPASAGTDPSVGGEADDLDPSLENLEAKEPQALLNLKKELEEKMADFEEQKKRSQEDLFSFERRQSQIILGNIYQALRDLAQEEQISLVVDKSSILFGGADTDLTNKLQEKVRGY
jgi:Skp family chaperone for outer membrane proteins